MRFAKDSKAAQSNMLKKVIYVEGQDDAWFLDCILSELEANPLEVGIVYINGTGAIEKEASLLFKSSGYIQRHTTHIAFLLDADLNPAKTIKPLNKVVSNYGVPA